jgi:hypothetical protein
MKSALLTILLAGFVLVEGVCAGSVGAGDTPRVVYVKSFPGSTPAYIEIAIDKSGAGIYKEDPKDEDPLTFQLGEPATGLIWDLTARLGNFGRKLESGLKVANMGQKTLRYEGPDGSHEAKFNYSQDPDAKALNDLFDQIGETERAYSDLERAVRFDKLGVQDALLRVETLRDQKRLVPQTQVLPLLDRVAGNESFLHMARQRAATLADTIRQPK